MSGPPTALIFTLGEILGVTDTVGGDVLEMTADNFRQCLARARRDLHSFMNDQCGLVNRAMTVAVRKKTRGIKPDRRDIDPQNLLFVPEQVQRIRDIAGETAREIEDLVEQQHAAIFREHPFLQPADEIHWLRRMLEREDVPQCALHLNSKNLAKSCHGRSPRVSMRSREQGLRFSHWRDEHDYQSARTRRRLLYRRQVRR